MRGTVAIALLTGMVMGVGTLAGASTPPSSGPSASAGAGAAGTTLAVPADYPTIQEAVDAAAAGRPGALSPGTYNEAVNVTTPNLTIRGLDRNKVILDGQLELDNGIRVLGADGVAVENMTALNYTANGFFWTGVDGYRGVVPHDLPHRRLRHLRVRLRPRPDRQLATPPAAPTPASTSAQCFPCDAVIDHVVSEHNGLGYSGTNSGGNLLIVNSTFRNNRAGIVPNSGSYELCYPERRDDDRRQPRLLQQPGRHPGDRRRPPGAGQRHPARRRRAPTSSSATASTTTTGPASDWCRSSRRTPNDDMPPRRRVEHAVRRAEATTR